MGLKEQVVKDIIRECIEPLLELKKGFEKQENRVDEITEDSLTEKYPSVNAVINFVKNKLTDFSNSISTVYTKVSEFEIYKKDVKTSFENLEKGVADTYATKTVVDGLKTNTEVTRTATGNVITIESSQAPLQNLKLFGKTEQNGTPTPDAPVPLVCVGDSGSFDVGVYGNNFWDMNALTIGSGGTYNTSGDTITFSGYENLINYFPFGIFVSVIPNTNYTLSFKATSLNTLYIYTDWYFGKQVGKYDVVNGKVTFNSGNHTVLFLGLYSYSTSRTGASETVSNIMLNIGIEPLPYEPCNKQSLTMPYTLRGKGDIKDEIDFARGVFIQKCVSVTGFSQVGTNTNTKTLWKKIDYNMVNDKNKTLCSHTDNYAHHPNDNVHFYVSATGATVYVPLDVDANSVEVIATLETPVEIPLTESELNDYRHLMTNKGTTTILSECEDTEITYYVNKPNAQAIGKIHTQVNEDYFKLQQAIIETGGN